MAASGRILLARLRRSPVAAFAESARAAAASRGDDLYLVGGCVRDLLLGVRLRDLDLSVVGDAHALAAEIAVRAGGRVGAESLFGTCRVDVPPGSRIDVAAARRERYARPAALPTVERADIREDLARRDFTINAMAIGLTGPDAGRLLDPAGGRRDLAARRLRLLHDRSLIDDPTRAFRGARYAARFALRASPGWSGSLSAAVRAGSFRSLSPARLRREIALIWSEPDPAAVLRRCGRWGLLRLVDPTLAWTPRLASALKRAAGARPPGGPGPIEPLFALLAWSMSGRGRAAFCERLGLVGGARKAILDAAGAPERARRLLRGLSTRPAGEEAFRRLEEVSAWAPLALDVAGYASTARVRAGLRRAVRQWQEAVPSLGGRDLIRMGVPRGPCVRAILRRLRRERLERAVRSRREEVSLVQSWLGAGLPKP